MPQTCKAPRQAPPPTPHPAHRPPCPVGAFGQGRERCPFSQAEAQPHQGMGLDEWSVSCRSAPLNPQPCTPCAGRNLAFVPGSPGAKGKGVGRERSVLRSAPAGHILMSTTAFSSDCGVACF